MNLYRSVASAAGTHEAHDLAHRLAAWHDAMAIHCTVGVNLREAGRVKTQARATHPTDADRGRRRVPRREKDVRVVE